MIWKMVTGLERLYGRSCGVGELTNAEIPHLMPVIPSAL